MRFEHDASNGTLGRTEQPTERRRNCHRDTGAARRGRRTLGATHRQLGRTSAWDPVVQYARGYETSPVEAIAGLRWRAESGWTAAIGAGPGIARGYGSPDFRAAARIAALAITVGALQAIRPFSSESPRPLPCALRVWDPDTAREFDSGLSLSSAQRERTVTQHVALSSPKCPPALCATPTLGAPATCRSPARPPSCQVSSTTCATPVAPTG